MASFAARRQAAVAKNRRRMKTACREIAAQLAGYATRRHLARLVYDDSQKGFCSQFLTSAWANCSAKNWMWRAFSSKQQRAAGWRTSSRTRWGEAKTTRILVLGYRRAQRDQRPGRWPPEALAEGGRTIEDTCAWRSRPRRDRYQQQVMAGTSSIGHSGLEGNHYQQTLMARCCAIG